MNIYLFLTDRQQMFNRSKQEIRKDTAIYLILYEPMRRLRVKCERSRRRNGWIIAFCVSAWHVMERNLSYEVLFHYNLLLNFRSHCFIYSSLLHLLIFSSYFILPFSFLSTLLLPLLPICTVNKILIWGDQVKLVCIKIKLS